MKIKPVSKQQNIVVQELEKEFLVYDLKTNKAFCLNETCSSVFQLCDGTKTIAEISDAISRKLNTLVSEDFVRLALNELNKDGLLENANELKEFFAGISRREIVKKVGLASMIALPIVSSVTAPSAIMAASCVNPGGGPPGAVAGGGCSGNDLVLCANLCSTIPQATSQCCSGMATAIVGGGCSLPLCCVCV